MIMKALKWTVISAGTLGVAGGAIFGSDVFSYIHISARSMSSAVKDAVPMQFEIRRARDLLDEVIPEMQANIRLVAQQEVEIDALRDDISHGASARQEQIKQVEHLRDALASPDTKFKVGPVSYTRDQVKDELANRLETVKEADVVLAGKTRLLDSREKALASAMQALEHARSQKSLLEGQIAALEGQYRLLLASNDGTTVQVDDSKLAQTQRLIADIKKRLDTAERVLAYEGKFESPSGIEVTSEKEVVAQADEYLTAAK